MAAERITLLQRHIDWMVDLDGVVRQEFAQLIGGAAQGIQRLADIIYASGQLTVEIRFRSSSGDFVPVFLDHTQVDS